MNVQSDRRIIHGLRGRKLLSFIRGPLLLLLAVALSHGCPFPCTQRHHQAREAVKWAQQKLKTFIIVLEALFNTDSSVRHGTLNSQLMSPRVNIRHEIHTFTITSFGTSSSFSVKNGFIYNL